MKNKNNLLLLVIVLAAFTACGPSIRVSSDYDKDMNVAGYKTYSWLDVKSIEQRGNDPRYINELTDKRIKEAVNAEMSVRGLKWISGKADMELHYHIVIDEKTMTFTEPVGSRFSRYMERRTSTYQYKEGTLIIDMMDTKTNELVWRGWATDVITEKAQQKPVEAINYAVKEIMKNSPFHSL